MGSAASATPNGAAVAASSSRYVMTTPQVDSDRQQLQVESSQPRLTEPTRNVFTVRNTSLCAGGSIPTPPRNSAGLRFMKQKIAFLQHRRTLHEAWLEKQQKGSGLTRDQLRIGMKMLMVEAIRYQNNRKQLGKPHRTFSRLFFESYCQDMDAMLCSAATIEQCETAKMSVFDMHIFFPPPPGEDGNIEDDDLDATLSFASNHSGTQPPSARASPRPAPAEGEHFEFEYPVVCDSKKTFIKSIGFDEEDDESDDGYPTAPAAEEPMPFDAKSEVPDETDDFDRTAKEMTSFDVPSVGGFSCSTDPGSPGRSPAISGMPAPSPRGFGMSSPVILVDDDDLEDDESFFFNPKPVSKNATAATTMSPRTAPSPSPASPHEDLVTSSTSKFARRKFSF